MIDTHDSFIVVEEVKMGEMKTINEPQSIMFTTGLFDCSALAIFYNKGSLGFEHCMLAHLIGSSLLFGLIERGLTLILRNHLAQVKRNDMILWVGGINASSDYAIGSGLCQRVPSGQMPILDSFINAGTARIVSSDSIFINNDGTYTFGLSGRGELDNQLLKSIIHDPF